ncbi:MAG: gluconokinase [Cyclobacteriaceae bacterium]
MSIVVMGVAGSGKSTIGQMLAKQLGLPFADADEFHPQSNIEKMRSGTPLNDDDRRPWLEILAQTLYERELEGGIVLACSGLKSDYRKVLNSKSKNPPTYVYLKGSKDLIMQRMKQRSGHFMPQELLDSQFDTLEEPQDAIIVGIESQPEFIVSEILKNLNSND